MSTRFTSYRTNAVLCLLMLFPLTAWTQIPITGPQGEPAPTQNTNPGENFEAPVERSILEREPLVPPTFSESPTDLPELIEPAPKTIEEAPTPIEPLPDSVDAGESIDRFLTRLILDSIPHNFTDDKKWGKQDERWDGIKWKREGLKVSTKRRKKLVNHGTWRKYSAELMNPEEEFTVQVKNLHKLKNGLTGFDVHCSTHLKIDARQSKWVKGVQLYSISAEGHTKLRLIVSCELGVDMDITKFPPDLIFRPHIRKARINVDEFRIDRVSKAGGEFAQQVTRFVRKEVDQKVRDHEKKLAKRLNGQIEKKKDKLRLSISDAVSSKFATKEARQLLPEDVRKAMNEN